MAADLITGSFMPVTPSVYVRCPADRLEAANITCRNMAGMGLHRGRNRFELSMMNCEALTFVVAQLHALKVVQGYQCLGNALL